MRSVAPRGSRRPKRWIREVATVVKIITYQLESKVLRPWKGSIISSRWYLRYLYWYISVVAGIDAQRFVPSASASSTYTDFSMKLWIMCTNGVSQYSLSTP